MKSLKKISSEKIKYLLQDGKIDFRIIPFLLVFIYILILFFSEFYLGSYTVIGKYFKIHPIPYFVDLKILLCGLDAIREGADPYSTICYNGGPYFNYPYIWGFLSLIPFATASNLIYIGLGLALTLFTTLYFYIGKINFLGAIVYTLLFVSPAIMLGAERGNCDLIIFILLLIPLFRKNNNGLFAFIILITSLLKLFPIGAIICILNNATNKIKKSFWFFVSVILIFLMYLVVMRENIIMVSQKTPRPYGEVSYGLGGIPSMFIHYFKLQNYFSLKIFIFTIFIALLFFIFFIFYRLMQKNTMTPLVDSGRKGVSYLIGAGIFTTTCLIGYNWEYRLIFLLLTVPQILSWVDEGKITGKSLLVLSILVVWQSFTTPLLMVVARGLYLFNPLLVILLFFGHLYILLDFLNNYYKALTNSPDP